MASSVKSHSHGSVIVVVVIGIVAILIVVIGVAVIVVGIIVIEDTGEHTPRRHSEASTFKAILTRSVKPHPPGVNVREEIGEVGKITLTYRVSSSRSWRKR